MTKYHQAKKVRKTNQKVSKHQFSKTKEEIRSIKISLREDINRNKKRQQKLMDLKTHPTV